MQGSSVQVKKMNGLGKVMYIYKFDKCPVNINFSICCIKSLINGK